MQRFRVMVGGFNFSSGELRDDRISVVHVDHELVVNGFVLRRVVWHSKFRIGKDAAILACNFLPARGPAIEIAQFDAKHRALKSLHAIVVTDEFVLVARCLAVGAGGASVLRNRIIVRGESAAFSIGAQVFAGIKAERGGMAEAADAAAAISGAVRLGGIFQYEKSEFFGD